MKFCLVALLVFIGHCHFVQCDITAFCLDRQQLLIRFKMNVMRLKHEFQEFINHVDQRYKPNIIVTRRIDDSQLSIVKDCPSLEDIQQFVVKESTEMKAAVIFIYLKNHSWIPLYVYSLRAIKYESAEIFPNFRLILLSGKEDEAHEEVSQVPNSAYYLDQQGEMKCIRLIETNDGLGNENALGFTDIKNAIDASRPQSENGAGMVEVYFFLMEHDVLVKENPALMQPYMKYLHNNHKHAFIILINAALDRRSMALIVAVERMIPVHTFLFNFEAYQTYAVSRKDQIRRQIIPRYLEGPSTIDTIFMAVYRNENGLYSTQNLMEIIWQKDFQDFIAKIDPAKDRIKFYLVDSGDAIFTKFNEQGLLDYSSAQQYLLDRVVANSEEAVVLIQVGKLAAGKCIDSLRIIRAESETRTISIGHDSPFHEYPQNSGYYLDGDGELVQEDLSNFYYDSPLAKYLEEIAATDDTETEYKLNVIIYYVEEGGDITFENEPQYIKQYLIYLHGINANAFIIIYNNVRTKLQLILNYLNKIYEIHVTTLRFMPYQKYPAIISHKGESIPFENYVFK